MNIIALIWHFFTTFFNSLQDNTMILDGLRVLLAGTFFEFSRRTATSAWSTFTDSFFITATISDNDEAYDWVSQYLETHAPIMLPSTSSQPQHFDPARYTINTNLMEAVYPTGRAAPRHIHLAAKRPRNNRGNGQAHRSRRMRRDMYDSESDDHESDDDEEKDAILHVEPSSTISQYMQFQNKTIQFQIKDDGLSSFAINQRKWLIMSTFLGTHDIFTTLIQTARKEYLAQLPKRAISIYSPEHGSWYKKSTRTMRPWDSIILPDGVKGWLLADATEFLAERDFYEERGVPHRRGYLLYGEPGSGKSSLISALAAQLRLDIYIVNIGGRYLDDDTLSSLMQDCPSRCILLMEDIDCAFKKRKLPGSKRRTTPQQDEPNPNTEGNEEDNDDPGMFPPNSGATITLSGLLNALDGVASSEGRLLFCTTNWKDKIDPALCRPGRCDVWVEFKHATREQARDLFIHFFRARLRSDPHNPVDITSNSNANTEKPFNSASPHTDNGEDLLALGEKFAGAIPKSTVSVSALQGYLVRYKRDPHAAAEHVGKWVEGGCGQGPTMFIKDGRVQEREVDEVVDAGDDSGVLDETKNEDRDINGEPNGHVNGGDKAYRVFNGGIEKNVNGMPNGWGDGNSTAIAQGNILRRARTHFRTLSRGK
ncbi:hypothetical protein L486_05267 [Kwoniella mangroviensis CBS 10435]|uniref:AAA+ ATPase domain-containing protein n=1 Tax=Kwoniella mangroviensis CBS 10435 TaxID=1331196 RepID=A0A1B9IQI9_9TREE|nr:hypothetical protein L486_05267 [Kwoniella mangroviensis CBS 10435]